MRPLVAWLHLSDIHFGHGSASHRWDQQLVLSCLHGDLARARTWGAPTPELIVVTGDIAFSGASRVHVDQAESTEYQEASRWLLRVGQGLSIGPSRIFVVPGNHDVQRSADRDPAIKHLVQEVREGRLELDAALADPSKRVLLARRQANYLTWAAGFAPACTQPPRAPEERLFWTHRMDVPGGLRIRFVGLNTALLSADDADQGQLQLGTEQLARALLEPHVEPHEFIVVLSHHPLRSRWLADEQNADAWIRNHAHLHLCGHVHEADSEQARSGAGGLFVRVVAGAAHGDQSVAGSPAGYGYNVAALFLADGGQLVLRLWTRRWSHKNKAFTEDPDNVLAGQRYSEHALRLRLLPTEKAVKPSSPEALPESPSHQYDIALSFASEDREIVERCAQLLSEAGYRVFYDRWEQHALLGKDLIVHLDSVYREAARYCLIFISKHYVAKAWTRHELRSAQARALESHREYILPTRLDDTHVPGLPDTIGYLDLRSHSVEEFVRILTRKLGPVRRHVDVGHLLWSTNVEDRLLGLRSAAFQEKEPQHLERLLELLHGDPDGRIRERAALALDALGDIRAKDGLLEALEDPVWGVRSQAGWGLVHLGKAVLEDVLRVARTAKNPDAVEMARLVLDRI